ncbi:MAG: nucleotidyltransferase family protein [Bacillota bacterium]
MIMNKLENEIIKMIEDDKWMMDILEAANSLNLPDWWICAGFVRSKIWDTLHGFSTRTEIPDVDVVYFDSSKVDEAHEKVLEKKLAEILPGVRWSVKNEARMHIINNLPPYTSSVDAISKFPETATAIGVKLDEVGNTILTAPHGLEDVLNMEIRATPHFRSKELFYIYEERLIKKNWPSIWKKVKVYEL